MLTDFFAFIFYRALTQGHSKRHRRSTSDTSSHSAYSSSSQSQSSQSSYSSVSSSPSHSHRSRSSSYSSQSRSLSSHHSGSYSKSSISSSSHSPPCDFKSRSSSARHQHVKTHGIVDKRTASSAKSLQSSSVIRENSRTDMKYRQKDHGVYRDRMPVHSKKVVERIYRPHSRRSRSSPRLRDRVFERNRHSSYSRDHRRCPYSTSRERRTIDRLRRSPPVDSNYSRGRMHPSHGPLKLRHRTMYSPTLLKRRHRMHSLDRSRQLIGRSRSSRLPSTGRERKLETVELRHRDKNHVPKKTENINANNGKRTSEADQLGKNDREQKEITGRTAK